MKIAVAHVAQESNSFAPTPCSWAQFEAGYLLRGTELLDRLQQSRTEMGGALDAAADKQVQVVPLMACSAVSGGPVAADVFDTVLKQLLDRLQAAMPVDGIYVGLHGSMVAENADDASGRILDAVRETVGTNVPIASSLDLHANVTQRMVNAADILVGYHTFPHMDMYETGARAMELLIETIATRIKPVIALRRLPMLLPAENGTTTRGPYAEVMQQVIELEKQAGILSVSAFSVQPWLDVPDVGCSVIITSNGDQALAEREADRLADAFWARRQAFAAQLVPLRDAIAQAISAERGPIIFSDPSDAPSSGAPGDSTVILKALLEAGIGVETLINIVDAEAVSVAISAGVGADVSLSVGARSTTLFCSPVEVSGRVRLISDGVFRFKGPGFHGVEFQRGRTVVVQIGSIYLEIMERPVLQWDAELYRSVGLEPRDARIVVVKSPAGFRAAYEPFAADIVIVDTPGVCSPNLRSFPWKRLGSPCYPLDDIADWRERPLARNQANVR